jgi:hypothetical protein
MRHDDVPVKNDPKQMKFVLKKLEKSHTHLRRQNESVKRLRIVQSVKSGHIRGGHAFH